MQVAQDGCPSSTRPRERATLCRPLTQAVLISIPNLLVAQHENELLGKRRLLNDAHPGSYRYKILSQAII